MSSPIIVLVHGMGNHTAPKPSTNERGSFGEEVIDGLTKGFQHFDSLKDIKPEKKAAFVEIHYNDIFDKLRKELAENATSISDLVESAKLGGVPGVVESILKFESKLNQDDFEYTHWLDVALYKSFYGQMIRDQVAEQLASLMAVHNGRDIHLVAHSLGTGVVHDTLQQLYTTEYTDHDRIQQLSTMDHKIDSLWMIANVSRLLSTVLRVKDPYKSLVKPSKLKSGVCRAMFNVHHQLDPFTWPLAFERNKEDNWVPQAAYRQTYADIETKMIKEWNTHSITQYLEDPNVVASFSQRVLGIRIGKDEFKEAKKAYKDSGTIEGKASDIKKAFKSVKKGDEGSLKDLFEACNGLYDLIKSKED